MSLSQPSLPGWQPWHSGKVRDLYLPDLAALGGQHPLGDVVLVVASDRVSAFDHVLPTEIPDKGVILTQLSLWWFDQVADVVPHHVLSVEPSAEPGDGLIPREVAGRAMICERLTMLPVECVARGYLTGSGLAEYRAGGSVTGITLPVGLVDGSRLPAPIFTPAMKAAVGEHDENVPFSTVEAEIGSEDAQELRDLTLALYQRAEGIARERGIILADTKFEFGKRASGRIALGDEVLTSDSSRFWDAQLWHPGQAQPSFDKQILRDWLASRRGSGELDADGTTPPTLPEAVVERTRERYAEAYTRLTGLTL
ncbi:MAG: phosphoribosylaminoimidazolesuccinocarboxamide synthase [Cellulomonadaceae bacterium]|jgi:phosphoribosylaminoimidazole-succinocarboxamide synthase|nr:phosphoribosylaminoimidazolesuccinocarboxamide synthase [Cellulomonadaceae bacterium]